jgi:predicted ribosome quality control (RQC) complex YloA/Tae2 family protein
MEKKRELTSVDCAALVRELGAYEGAKVDKAYLYGEDLLRLKLRDFERGRLELLVEVGDPKRAHLSAPERIPDAPGRPPNFAMMLRNRISGADFAGVEQFEFDRILTFHFERDDGDTRIVAELFGDGNVAVCDGNYEVVGSLETVRLKSRTVAPGSLYDYPSSRFNPMTVDREGFDARMEGSDTDLVRTLATQLNFGGLWAEELCTRAGVEKTKAIDRADEADYEALYGEIDRLRTVLRSGELDPRVYYEDEEDDGSDGGEDGRRVDVTPVPLEERESLRAERFSNFNGALDDYFYHFEEESDTGGSSGAGDDRPDFEEEIAKYERIIAQQEGAIEDFEADAREEREKAELLYSRYDLVDQIIEAVRSAREEDTPWEDIADRFDQGAERGIEAAEAVADVNGAQGTVTLEIDDTRVTVDPSMGVEKNADHLYQEAKRVEGKKEGALEAIEDTREQLADAKERRDRWSAGDGEEADDEGAEGEEEEVDWLSRGSVPVRRDEQWYEQFRWFHTSDGFLVIGGRSADENEEIVKKYMERGDRFFHTQAHGAPATVLKATGPSEAAREVDFPEQSLEEAAQFAISYSSVWKDGHFSGDVYMVEPDQVSKTPESGEYVEKGSFVIRGDRTYFRDTPVGCAVGIAVEPQSQVLGGPPSAVESRTVSSIAVEPGRYAQNDIAKMLYREFRDRFADETFVRKVASPDKIQEFLPAGGSRTVDD